MPATFYSIANVKPATLHPIADVKATERDLLSPYYDKAVIAELRVQLDELRRDIVKSRELGRRLFAATVAALGAAAVANLRVEVGAEVKKRWFTKVKKRWFI
jgi:hypothetical protein